MKTLAIKELLVKYKRELKFIDFDDDLELVNMLAIRNQLIDRLEALTDDELKIFDVLEKSFVDFSDDLKGFENMITLQNSKLYKKKVKKAA